MYKKFITFISFLDNSFFPSRCVSCRLPGKALCPACRPRIKVLPLVCPFCGSKNATGMICPHCRQSSFASFDGAIALGSYEDNCLKTAIRALKYQGVKEIGVILGRLLGRRLAAACRHLSEPLLLPLPLHPRRERERGYNQASYIAKGVRQITDWAIVSGLERKRYQPATTRLGYQARHDQQKVFVFEGTEIKDRAIILIDDVITTGTTASAATAALKAAGAATVIIATLARSG